jgi:hypothetical protein
MANDCCCANNEQPTQIPVSLLEDASELRIASGGILLRRQAEPGGKLSTRLELLGIGDGGGHSCCCDYNEAGDCSVTGLIFRMPRKKLTIQRRALFGERRDLPDQDEPGP